MRLLGMSLLLIAALLSQAWAGYRPPELNLSPPSNEAPKFLKEIGLDQRLDNQVPMNLKFRDEEGKEVELSQYAGKKPILLSLVYFECPMLCNEVLNGLTRSLRVLPLTVGKDFVILTVSFDPREKPELAAKKKANYVKQYNKPEAAKDWHFLTGDQASIKAITEAVGFRYVWDEKLKQFAHASGIMLLTPEGKVSRYFFGIEYPPKDLRLGLSEASSGKVGSVVDRVLLLCYHYDPSRGRYSFMVVRAIQIGGFLTLAALSTFIGTMLWRESRRNRRTLAEQVG